MASTDTETVAAAKPISPWFGGKARLASTIVPRIEAIEHRCYAEPFVGMGGIFLRRKTRVRSEVINDLNGDVANLFRVVREHPDELARQFEWTLSSRAEFERFVDIAPHTLTDIQRAARFAFMHRMSFSGKTEMTRGQMGVKPHRSAPFNAASMRHLIAAANHRLQGVHVESLDWRDFIRRYDRPFTLFYLDPPYWGHEEDYGKGLFARDDFAAMAETLAEIQGRFLLSVNDVPELREMFHAFTIDTVTTSYTPNVKATRKATELLISN